MKKIFCFYLILFTQCTDNNESLKKLQEENKRLRKEFESIKSSQKEKAEIQEFITMIISKFEKEDESLFNHISDKPEIFMQFGIPASDTSKNFMLKKFRTEDSKYLLSLKKLVLWETLNIKKLDNNLKEFSFKIKTDWDIIDVYTKIDSLNKIHSLTFQQNIFK